MQGFLSEQLFEEIHKIEMDMICQDMNHNSNPLEFSFHLEKQVEGDFVAPQRRMNKTHENNNMLCPFQMSPTTNEVGKAP